MDSKLYNAAITDDVDHLQSLTLEQKANIPFQLAPNQNTLLHVATEFHQLNFAKAVVQSYPLLLWRQNSSHDTALHIAAREGLEDFINFFIDCVADVENGRRQEFLRMVNSKGDTALHCAARLGRYNSLKKLISVDPQLCSIVNNDGESPLYLAVASRCTNLHPVIIELAPTWASYRGAKGQTALHPMVYLQNYPIDMIKLLVNWKRELIQECDCLGLTPLHYASFYGRVEAIKLFLEYDSSASYKLDKEGESALHFAAFQGHIDAMKEIIECCPDSCYLINNKGRTALHAAVLGEQRKVIKFILENRTYERPMNKPDGDGNMPLHLATHFKLYDVIKIFAKYKHVDFYIKNKQFLTALDVYNKHWEEGLRASVTRNLLDGSTGIMTMQHMLDKKIKEMNPEMTTTIESTPTDLETKNKENHPDSEKKSALEVNMLVAILVATVTFAAGLSMPSGNVEDGRPNTGKTANLTTSSKVTLTLQVFVASNIVAFCCSIFAVLLHFHTSLADHRQRVRYMGIAASFTTISLFALVLAFASGTHIELTKSFGFSITPYVICACFVLLYFALPFCDPGAKGFPCLHKPQKFVQENIIIRFVRYEWSDICRM